MSDDDHWDDDDLEEEHDDAQDTEQEAPKKKRRRRRKRDPERPRGALSAYMYFGQTLRPVLTQQHPNAGVTEIAKMIGQRWRELSEEDKKPYQQLAEQDKERYKREMENYTPTPGYETKGRRKKKDPAEPKRPMSAYFLFSNERRASIKAQNPEFKLGDVAKAIGEEWRQMSDSQKKPYFDKAADLKEKYKSDMETYRANNA